MRLCIRLVAGVLPLLLAACAAPDARGEGPAVVVVRHAERLDDSAEAPLSRAGIKRATALARVLARARLDAVCASQNRRTQLTAAPAAGAAGLEVRIAPIGDDIAGWARGNAPEPGVVVDSGDADETATAAVAKALAHPARVRIVRLLLARETCIGGDRQE